MEEESVFEQGPVELEKEVVCIERGWFESIAFWPKKGMVKVHARQIVSEKCAGLVTPVAGGELEITKNEFQLFKDSLTPMVCGRAGLLIQVQALSEEPGRAPRRWQKVMKDFCLSFPDFRPVKIYWPKEQLLD